MFFEIISIVHFLSNELIVYVEVLLDDLNNWLNH